MKVIDLGKPLDAPKRGGTLGGRDMKGNALVHDAMIKCEQG